MLLICDILFIQHEWIKLVERPMGLTTFSFNLYNPSFVFIYINPIDILFHLVTKKLILAQKNITLQYHKSIPHKFLSSDNILNI